MAFKNAATTIFIVVGLMLKDIVLLIGFIALISNKAFFNQIFADIASAAGWLIRTVELAKRRLSHTCCPLAYISLRRSLSVSPLKPIWPFLKEKAFKNRKEY